MMNDLLLRDVTVDDLPHFFRVQVDPVAEEMAAFTSCDPAHQGAFAAHWQRIQADPSIIIKTIVFRGQVAGSVMSYEELGRTEVSYWLGRGYWGQGIATRALTDFLAHVNTSRPIYARAASDNNGSLRVLEKCGFTMAGQDQAFANLCDEEIDEFLLVLHA